MYIILTCFIVYRDPTLVQVPQDLWRTAGRYNLLTRHLRGGISGSGDVHHPANVVFKVRINFNILLVYIFHFWHNFKLPTMECSIKVVN